MSEDKNTCSRNDVEIMTVWGINVTPRKDIHHFIEEGKEEEFKYILT
jgi:hypothetical protein